MMNVTSVTTSKSTTAQTSRVAKYAATGLYTVSPERRLRKPIS